MPTVLDSAIAPALKDLGVLSGTETPTAEEAADALVALNGLLDQWASEDVQMYSLVRTTWAIVSGTQDYTLYTGGTINAARPASSNLITINFMDTSPTPDIEFPLRPLTDAEYAAVPSKAETSTYPRAWYLKAVYPQAILSLFPIPTSTTLTGVMYAPSPVSQFAASSDSLALPPGYARMIRKNLAVELAPSYSRQVDPLLFKAATDSLLAVKRSNTRLVDMQFGADVTGTGGGGWFDARLGP